MHRIKRSRYRKVPGSSANLIHNLIQTVHHLQIYEIFPTLAKESQSCHPTAPWKSSSTPATASTPPANAPQTEPSSKPPTIAKYILAEFQAKGYDAQLLVPETEDIPLKERVRRVNARCTALGKTNVILISIHDNAAGDGSQWMNATGWSCYTCKWQTESDLLANCLYKASLKKLSRQAHQNGLFW